MAYKENELRTQDAAKYWIWESKLSPDLCNIILSDADKIIKKEIASIGNNKGIINPRVRNTEIKWLEVNHWLEGVFYNHVRYANISANWNYKIDSIEQVQVGKYIKNSHYDWHVDWAPLEPGKIRKLSIVCLLSDPSEYEGGEFEMEGINEIKLKQGSILVFPSYINHRVKPITNGVRISAVSWVSGDNTL